MKTILFFLTFILFLALNVSGQPAIEWQNTIGGTERDDLHCMRQTPEGGYILGGTSKSDSSGDKLENSIGGLEDWDYWVIKTDSLGVLQWQNTIGGYDSDYLMSIQTTYDGGYMLGGYSRSNISGDKHENNFDNSNTTFDYWIVKIDSTGTVEWENTIGGSGDDALYTIEETQV